jgi:MFS family permease
MSKKEHLLLWGGNLWYLGEGMLGPLFAVLTQRVGGNILDITWAWAVYLAVTGVLIILIGAYSDRLAANQGREKLMLLGYGLNAVFTFGYLFVASPLHLFIVQAGLGVAMALSVPTWLALYDEHSSDEKDGFIWGLQGGEQRLISAAAILIGGFIVTTFSFDALFITMGGIQILAFFYQSRILFVREA